MLRNLAYYYRQVYSIIFFNKTFTSQIFVAVFFGVAVQLPVNLSAVLIRVCASSGRR